MRCCAGWDCLRAIGDPRAVPALIRALPKTLLPSSSDYGLIVSDKELMAFMQTHDLDQGKGEHFGLGRPEREIIGALHDLTGQNFEDAELFSMSLSEDPRRQILQRRVYRRQASAGRRGGEELAEPHRRGRVSKVNLNVADEPLPALEALEDGPTQRRNERGSSLSGDPGRAARLAFFDLDAGYRLNWPARIPKVEASAMRANWRWVSQTASIDVHHPSCAGRNRDRIAGGGMEVREISPRDVRNLDRLIAAGTLPEGRPAGELLMHYDPQSEQLVPDANAAFLFVTREGNMGLIETTDRVTRTADLTGLPAGPSPGVGFHKGVRFNLKAIIP
jgi:hypothetical protein